jgi:hypothetical protein
MVGGFCPGRVISDGFGCNRLDTDKLLQCHRASSAGEAKRKFEDSAQVAGFGIVTWIGVNAADLTVAARTGLNA